MNSGDAGWRGSSFSTETADCVEIGRWSGTALVGIRDSKNPAGGHLVVTAGAFRRLLDVESERRAQG